jgi:adenylylsulfate kinase
MMIRVLSTKRTYESLLWIAMIPLTSALSLTITMKGGVALSIAILIDSLLKGALILAYLRRTRPLPGKASVIWFTGLSGAGKSTLAREIHRRLSNRGVRVEMLDGDALRDVLPGVGFSREERILHIRRAGLIASFLEKSGITVVASFISPYREAREYIRAGCRNYIEIYVSTPIEVCEERDVKGLYGRVRSGEIKNFTGIDDPYEIPEAPDIEIDTSKYSIDEAADTIFQFIQNRYEKYD